jgi:hypothetical protein
MTSAKDEFFSNGAYEHVLANKQDRDIQPNSFGHSPFSRDSYLSSKQDESEGASEQGQEVQEQLCIMDALQGSDPLADPLDEDMSDASSVLEDEAAN